ncbi:SH3 domain-containing protein [Rufibacter immobilis]|uniref:SH3 domain-containing protein n=1 Tax=Rufibacter immobilis TaxID=1348778 RepID=A0A3M9N454_9BACT|nr:SH3 domain-containing protein [Rufibacter immobilis]RNI31973.1 SH3 domain-containing protein [Rufibacter immobilis]
MPNIFRKLSLLFCSLWLICAQPILAQAPNFSLAKADSLFSQHKYTQALQIYEQLLSQNRTYSPQMLLKMAYIHEGLHDYTQSMHYLQLYYSKHPSKSVLQKMEEVGLQQHLNGYEYTDWDFFKTQFYKYYSLLLELLLIVAAVFMTLLLRNWVKKQPISGEAKIGMLLYLGFVFYFANFLTLGQQGIIRNGNVPIMAAPSAGAGLVATVGTGHKVNILGEQDIWYRIEWNDQTAYIRKNNLLLLPQPLAEKTQL